MAMAGRLHGHDYLWIAGNHQRDSAMAEEGCTMADQMENLATREAMLDVAASYEHLEDTDRAHLETLPRLSSRAAAIRSLPPIPIPNEQKASLGLKSL